MREVRSWADLSLRLALVPASKCYKKGTREEARPLLLQRALIDNAVEEQNVAADGALAGINVPDKNNIDVFLDPGYNSGGVCKKSNCAAN
jgi:hypothetical protein